MSTGGDSQRVGRSQTALSAHYTIESHLASTRSADAYKAVEKAHGIGVCLWMLRHPLARQSDAVNRFLSRIKKIQELDSGVTSILGYGIDSSGMAYAALPALDGTPLLVQGLERAEAERRFTACVRMISILHKNGIVCGDLCGMSFWVSRDGGLRFVGVMGSFDAEAVATAALPPAETLHFLAPEQRSGGGIESATDVFAIGVIGYYLFTGQFPYPGGVQMYTAEYDINQVKPARAWNPTLPGWIDEILLRCLNPKPSLRFGSAVELEEGIIQARQRESEQALVSRAEPRPRRDSSTLRGPVVTAHRPEEVAPEPPAQRSSTRIIIIALAVSIGLGISAGVFLHTQRKKDDEARKKELEVYTGVVQNQQLEQAINVLGANEASSQERQNQLDKLAASDDPLAYDALIRTAREAKTYPEREMSERVILERARRLSLLRGAEQAKQWLRSVPPDLLPPHYDAVLKALDVTMPKEGREQTFKAIAANNGTFAVKLATALALDTGKLDDYQPLIGGMLEDSLSIQGAKARSVLSLVLAVDELSLLFGDDAIQRKDLIPNKDLLWLLALLGERGDQNVRVIANLASDRGQLSNIRKGFLGIVRDRNDLQPDVLGALVKAAAGAIQVADVAVFGRWYDLDAEKILYGVLADTTDKKVLLEAFDTAAGKSLQQEPGAGLVNWVRKNHWDDRADLARSTGILASAELLSHEEIEEGLKAFDPYVREDRLVDILLGGRSTDLARIVVRRYSSNIGTGSLVNLLESGDVEIRKAAVHALKGVNEIAVLKIILDRYAKEKDEEVRKAYSETFWMIGDRGAKNGQ